MNAILPKNNIVKFIVLSISLLMCLGCVQSVQDSDSIVIWHWMSDRDKTFQELAKRYEQKTGIKVIFQLFAPSDIYSQKIIASAQAHILPDIFGILDKKSVVADFIKSGFVADLTAEFKKDDAAWEKQFFPKALAVNRFETGNIYGIPPGIYGVPLDITTIQMVYNKKLFKKAGIKEVPKTFDQFIEAINLLNRVNIAGLVSGWGELWMIDCFAMNYALNIMGEEKIMATFRGEVPYTDPDWIKVFQVFESLSKNKALVVGIVTKANKYAEQDFALERAAFAFNGSWCVNVYNDMNPTLEYGVMLPPAVSPELPMKIWGGAGSSFNVNASSLRKEKAIAFLKWLTAKEQQDYFASATKNIPANRYSLESVSKMSAEFTRDMDNTTHPSLWPMDEDVLVKEKFDRGLQSIVIGERTPQEVAEEVQAIKERQIERQKRRNRR